MAETPQSWQRKAASNRSLRSRLRYQQFQQQKRLQRKANLPPPWREGGPLADAPEVEEDAWPDEQPPTETQAWAPSAQEWTAMCEAAQKLTENVAALASRMEAAETQSALLSKSRSLEPIGH